MKIVNIILLLLQASFILLCFSGKIAFGHGIGDIVYFGLAIVSFLVLLCFFAFISYKKSGKAQYVLAILMFIILLLFCLKATIYRGPEYSWHNHQIFYQ